jgi:hypothetical protein
MCHAFFDDWYQVLLHRAPNLEPIWYAEHPIYSPSKGSEGKEIPNRPIDDMRHVQGLGGSAVVSLSAEVRSHENAVGDVVNETGGKIEAAELLPLIELA